MKRRDIVIGLLVLVVLAGVVYWARRPKEVLRVETEPSVEQKIEDSFKLQIPDDVDKSELSDVSGGNSSGISTRKYENGKFTHSVLADIPDPESGEFYQGWLVKGDDIVSTGRLTITKGGYLLEFESVTDYSDHKGIWVTLEEKSDTTPEKHILEGSFE